MNKDIKIILVKFTLITIGIIIYTLIMLFYVSPMIAFAQSAFDNSNPYGQQQYNQYDQFGGQQYQDPYQQYGTPYQSSYPQYGMQQPYYGQQQYGGFGIQEIIAMIIAGGGGAAGGKYAADRKTKRLEELHRETMEAELKTKEQLKELARVTYNMNTEKANQINDAPTVQLDELSKDVDNFREKTAKA
jgi:hypothetical protein